MSPPDELKSTASPRQGSRWWATIQSRWAKPRLVLRIGRRELSLWRDAPAGLIHLAQVRAPELLPTVARQTNGSDVRNAWLTALTSILSHSSQGAHVDVIVESACMPVSLLDTGTRLWSAQQIQALVRHRLTTTYGDAAQHWLTQSSYLPGDTRALGFGLSPELRHAIEQAELQNRVDVRTIQPAMAWGWDRLLTKEWLTRGASAKTFWWIWPEQDRDILVWVARGRIQGLNPAAMRSDGAPQTLLSNVAFECTRLGVTNSEAPVRAASWRVVRSAASLPTTSSNSVQRLAWDVLIDTCEADVQRGAA